MSTLPSNTHSAPATPIYALSHGGNEYYANFTNLAWSNSSGTYISALTIPGLATTSVVGGFVADGTIADVTNCWMMSTTPTTNTMTIRLAANPATPASFKVAACVFQY